MTLLLNFLLVMLAPTSLAFQHPILFQQRNRKVNSLAPKAQIHSIYTRHHATLEWDCGAASALDDFFRTQPFLSAFVACSVKASAADFLAQKSMDTKSDTGKRKRDNKSRQHKNDAMRTLDHVDVQRNIAFLLYGGIYQGIFLQFLYLIVYPTLYEGSDFRIPLSILSDICAFGPFLTLPIAYIIRGMLEYNTTSKVTPIDFHLEPIHQAIAKYQNHVRTQNLLLKYWMVWAPAQTINWYFVPEHLHVLFVALVSFFWVYLLSSISSHEAEERETWATKSSLIRPTTQST